MIEQHFSLVFNCLFKLMSYVINTLRIFQLFLFYTFYTLLASSTRLDVYAVLVRHPTGTPPSALILYFMCVLRIGVLRIFNLTPKYGE